MRSLHAVVNDILNKRIKIEDATNREFVVRLENAPEYVVNKLNTKGIRLVEEII